MKKRPQRQSSGKGKRDQRKPGRGRKPRPASDPGKTRLNKYLAQAGIASRREADNLIKTGLVEVNGQTVTEMGYQVKPEDEVKFNGSVVQPEKPVYLALNKPKGFITTTSDEKARKTVMDLVANAGPERFYPVGRLDRQTTGILLLTNDGEMAKKLTHPSHGARKIYEATLDKNLSKTDLIQIEKGLELEDGPIKVDEISFVEGKSRSHVGLVLHSGRNRIVRRIFAHLGYEVTKLDRVFFAGITKKGLSRGQWRMLTPREINLLKMKH